MLNACMLLTGVRVPALLTPVKAIWVGYGGYENMIVMSNWKQDMDNFNIEVFVISKFAVMWRIFLASIYMKHEVSCAESST